MLDKQLTSHSLLTDDVKWDFYIPIGDLDVILVKRGSAEEKQLIPQLANVRNASSLRAFKVDLCGSRQEIRSPLNAILFLKLDEIGFSNGGFKFVETELLTQLSSVVETYRDRLNVEIFATLGWFEFFILVDFALFADLAKFVREIRLMTSTSSGLPVMQSTFSIPMVKCSIVKDSGTLAFPDLPSEDIEASLNVACRPKSEIDDLISFIRKRSKSNVSLLFGTDDVLFRFLSIPTNELFHLVMDVRKKFHDNLLYTKTCIALSDDEGDGQKGNHDPNAVMRESMNGEGGV